MLVAETGTRTIRRVHLTADGTPGATHDLGRRPARPPRQHRPRQRRPGLGDGGLADRQGPDACCRRALERCAAWCAGSPSGLKPKPKETARVMAFDSTGRTVHDLDFDATRWHLATGVREHDGRVWLGSLMQPAIAVGDVPELQP